MGPLSSVADAERAAIARAVGAHKETDELLVLSDSTTAIKTVMDLAGGKPPRSGIERALGTILKRRTETGRRTRIGWVRGHIDIPGNEMADQKATTVSDGGGPVSLVTEEGWKALCQKRRAEDRFREGYGHERYRWPRKAITGYTWCRTGKGPLGQWLYHTGKIEEPSCHLCGDGEESGKHLVFQCPVVQGRPTGIQEWKDLDQPRWQGEGKDRRNQVADFFTNLYGTLQRRQIQVGGGRVGRG